MDINDYLDEELENYGVNDLTAEDIDNLYREVLREQKIKNNKAKRALTDDSNSSKE